MVFSLGVFYPKKKKKKKKGGDSPLILLQKDSFPNWTLSTADFKYRRFCILPATNFC